MNCPNCGKVLRSSSPFCPSCGEQVGAATAAPTPPTAPPAPAPASNGVRSTGGLIVALTCPVCGANARPDDPQCDFCGAYLLVMTDLPKIDAKTLNQGVINQRIASFRETLHANPQDATARYGLGVAYYTLRLFEEAAVELERAVDLMPENPHIQTQLGAVYAELAMQGRAGYEAKAAGRIDRALMLRPDMVEALLLRASLAVRAGELDRAIADWERVLALQPADLAAPVSAFLRNNERVLATAPSLQATVPTTSTSMGARLRKPIVVGLGGSLLICVLAMIAVVLAPKDAAGNPTGTLSDIAGFLGLISMIAAPVLFFVQRRRIRSAAATTLAPSQRPATPQEQLRQALLAGTANPQDLVAAARYVRDQRVATAAAQAAAWAAQQQQSLSAQMANRKR